MDAAALLYYPSAVISPFDLAQELQAAAHCQQPEQQAAVLIAAARKLYESYKDDKAQGAIVFRQLVPVVLSSLYAMPKSAVRNDFSHVLLQLAAYFNISKNEMAKLWEPARTPVPQETEWKRSAIEARHPGTTALQTTTPQSPAPTRPTGIAPVSPSPTLERADVSLGHAIAEVFAQYGHAGVRYLPYELGENSRFNLLVFSWKAGDLPDKIKKRRYELALVGLNPEEIRIVIAQGVRLEDGTPEGRFEVHIPKEQWTPALLLPWLYSQWNGPTELRTRSERIQWLVHYAPKALPGEPLITTFGLDLRNQPVLIEHKKGVFSVGSPDSGKSASLRARLVQALLHHTPETLVVYAIDLKQVTFMPFAGLIHLVTEGSLILGFLRALLEENKRRNELFARAGVTDILQYNRKSASHPIPLIWVIWDEPNHTKRESKDPAEVSRIAEELTGLTRSTGIYWDISTQYPSREYAVTPATRNNLSEKILFQCSEAAADLVLETNGTSELASALLGDGDALVKVGSCRRKITRVQSFFVPDDPEDDHLYQVLHELREATLQGMRPALLPSDLIPFTTNPQLKGTAICHPSPDLEDPWSPVTNGTAVQHSLERAKWDLIQKVERYNQQNPNRKIPNRRLYAAVAGDRFLSPTEQQSYQVESLQSLIDQPQLPESDPRARIYLNGGNEQTARKYIDELRSRFAVGGRA
ncbi:MAG: FtsK/SpoIIIE domain-containing protein [Leptolyngbyaceae cyanobacterium bins.59]|nr:FtsK/SpoIIIE domain-containing protein [Leptolyngbyaceae cyanobacterium bins.59]